MQVRQGCWVIALLSSVSQKRHLTRNSVLFGMDSSAEDVFSLLVLPNFRVQKPFVADFGSALFPMLSTGFPFEIMYFIVQKTVYLCLCRT